MLPEARARWAASVIGADAHQAEDRLKAHDVQVTKLPSTPPRTRTPLLGTYPPPDTVAEDSALVLLVSSCKTD